MSKTKNVAPRVAEAPKIDREAEEKKSFFNMPNSPASNSIMEVLNAGKNKLNELPDRKRQYSNSQEVSVLEYKDKRLIKYSNNSNTSEVTIELSDINLLTSWSKPNPAKKLFTYTLVKANSQILKDGLLIKDYVTFPLQELIDIGFYKNIRSARKGFNDGADTLTSLKVKGKMKKSKNSEVTIDALEVLFTGANIKKGQCTIYLNNRINWGFIAQYFTYLPTYTFSLSNRAFDLIQFIFYLARQHTKDIEERGYFTIGFRAIQSRLLLPSEATTTNPQRDIKDVIEATIEKIEDAHSQYYKNTNFQLLPVCNEKAPIKEYLDHGYLKITMLGEFAKDFVELSRKQKKQIKSAETRKQKRIDNAISKNLAKKMEAEEKNNKKN
jgi:hypothetical protein